MRFLDLALLTCDVLFVTIWHFERQAFNPLIDKVVDQSLMKISIHEIKTAEDRHGYICCKWTVWKCLVLVLKYS